jgi:hypothetical protein
MFFLLIPKSCFFLLPYPPLMIFNLLQLFSCWLSKLIQVIVSQKENGKVFWTSLFLLCCTSNVSFFGCECDSGILFVCAKRS